MAGLVSPTVTDLRRDLRALLQRRRERTLDLIAPLGESDLHDQFFPIMGPVVWDVGHIGNFEELWLLRMLDGRAPHDDDLDRLYNPFENPRWVRGELPVLPREPALAYLDGVREEVLGLLDTLDFAPDQPLVGGGFVYRMIAQHESQHQETVLQALDLRDDLDPYPLLQPVTAPARDVDDEQRVVIPGGPFTLGTDDRRWSYDNERPAHRVDVASFAIDRFPVTVRRYAAFVADGGYADDDWWSQEGRAWRDETGHAAPQGWQPDGDGGWRVRRLGHLLALDPREPVQHVNFWEAEAFARWAGGRLPTEAEWEKAAAHDPATGRSRRYPWGDERPTPAHANVGLQHLGPRPVGSYPGGASAYGVEQMLGDVYQWTTSRFGPYPGFRAFPYPEYSEVFFADDYPVLRGASWAIAASVARATYRNWDHPQRRQIFSGVRLVWDLAPDAA